MNLIAWVSTHDNHCSAETSQKWSTGQMSTQWHPEGKGGMKCWGGKATYSSGLYGNKETKTTDSLD